MEDLGNNFVKLLKTLMKSVKQELGYAVEFPEDKEWLNTQEALTLEKLKGQVVLLDFWTYCCINCIHVLDDLKYLEDKYQKEPFVIIGVHSAKFKNEKDKTNIRSALARYEIRHPVLIDNEMKLWKKYKISAWPSFVLIGPDGKIIGKTAGEGQRTMLENSIEDALDKARKNKTLANKKIETKPDIFLDSYLKFPGKLDMNRSKKQLFLSDSNHNRILQLQLKDDKTAKILSIIGSNEAGLKDGSLEGAFFNKPQGILYSKNILYIADT
ncbi:MAG: redoxin domain-containing protein, partial [Candidatus Lokiarchaeota archaeon]|nr:redoxin domain-containing protein [Candidatus Lokiarchaeota archaeon]MBD3340279.1 redoxin domain-containing protein [Candidatus Lokiarchaeota archaeon]